MIIALLHTAFFVYVSSKTLNCKRTIIKRWIKKLFIKIDKNKVCYYNNGQLPFVMSKTSSSSWNWIDLSTSCVKNHRAGHLYYIRLFTFSMPGSLGTIPNAIFFWHSSVDIDWHTTWLLSKHLQKCYLCSISSRDRKKMPVVKRILQHNPEICQ